MIGKIIEFSIKNRFLVLLGLILTMAWGLYSVVHIPLDAIPDLSENQVVVMTDWPGRSPQIVEDQLTYPLSTSLQGLPGVKAIRAGSQLGLSMVYVIFNDNVDIYWARTRVSERLSTLKTNLPPGVTPMMGPDGTGVGHVFWYTVEGKGQDLGTLRAIQDWFVRPQLSSVAGVAEVASVGGFSKQYQVDLDPNRLSIHNLNVGEVVSALRQSNGDGSGGILEQNGQEFSVRSRGYVRGIPDIENAVVKTDANGTPILVKDVASVQMGSDLRRGLLEKNGEGEVAGGIVVMRYNENAKAVIDRVKQKIKEIESGLPQGVKIVPSYDRSELIERAVDNLKHSLIEEAVIVTLFHLAFMMHLASAFVIVLAIPISVFIAFIFMSSLGISSNIMSLGGIAIAVGVLVDSAIVMVENAYRRLAEGEPIKNHSDYIRAITESAKQVGRPIFFSLIIILLSFAPVFLLEGQEGKLFRPLALTKSFSMAGAAIIAITVVPVMMTFLLKGHLKPEADNPISRFFLKGYRPIIEWALNHRWTTIVSALLVVLLAIPVAGTIGKEFMPPLDEGSLLYMPTTLPDVNITEAKRLIQVQDKLIMSVPEVHHVLGKVGRAETATDPAPVSMFESIVLLKPKNEWRKGITKEDIISELDRKAQIPGVANGWTQPIINRINMLSTGVRTDLGVKFFGNDLDTLEQLAIEAEGILKDIPGAKDIYAERVIGGRYFDVELDRGKIARYGLNVGDVNDAIESALGGTIISNTVEGRQRFPIKVRYARDFRDTLEALQNTTISTRMGQPAAVSAPSAPSGGMGGMGANTPAQALSAPVSPNESFTRQVPLSQLASVRVTSGPPMISSENTMLRSIVYLNVRGRDMGSFVDEAKKVLLKKMQLPSGYYVSWSGQYENQIRANQRLQILIPIVLVIIAILLFFTFHSVSSAAMVLLSLPFALSGGIFLQKLLHFNFSVAVWVGYIALAGVAVETGVVMLIYLHEALDRKIKRGVVTEEDIREATIEGAVLRLRPKLMTVFAAIIGLLPIMWSGGTGSDVMRPIATPMIGGLLSSMVLVLVVLPVVFDLWMVQKLRKGTLRGSGTGHGEKDNPRQVGEVEPRL
ncbi:MAG TPA: CusA/CzcA family heavy metal efflux RND transporter [Cyanobacteria bacterium UBA8530]|nr:CusA/CzcA family heavy metal efflux RND transporter [Cyanobacteria bacterium UBA8530]